jgi:plastocyanin
MKKFNFLMAILASLFALQFAWAQPGNYDVDAGAFYFSPASLTIEAGSTVTWTNIGGFHDVNFETNSITGDNFNNPESFSLDAVYSGGPDSPVEIGSHTFTLEGTYYYDCSVGTHAAQGMIVQLL